MAAGRPGAGLIASSTAGWPTCRRTPRLAIALTASLRRLRRDVLPGEPVHRFEDPDRGRRRRMVCPLCPRRAAGRGWVRPSAERARADGRVCGLSGPRRSGEPPRCGSASCSARAGWARAPSRPRSAWPRPAPASGRWWSRWRASTACRALFAARHVGPTSASGAGARPLRHLDRRRAGHRGVPGGQLKVRPLVELLTRSKAFHTFAAAAPGLPRAGHRRARSGPWPSRSTGHGPAGVGHADRRLPGHRPRRRPARDGGQRRGAGRGRARSATRRPASRRSCPTRRPPASSWWRGPRSWRCARPSRPWPCSRERGLPVAAGVLNGDPRAALRRATTQAAPASAAGAAAAPAPVARPPRGAPCATSSARRPTRRYRGAWPPRPACR